jgi:glutamate-1-semialdehyde 2,1-aminomutase
MSHLKLDQTQAMFQRAKAVMPWGVTSNFRYWGEDNTPVITRGQGTYIWDADGNRYIDYRLAFGPIILGHADPRVNQSVIDAIANSTLFAHTHPLEIEVAERIVRMCPGVDKVRFANSGTEATMHALRIARAYTNREKFIKFEGGYHGFHDAVLFSTSSTPVGSLGSRRSPLAAQNSSGIPEVMRSLVISLVYNDLELLERTVRERYHEIAAIMVEPICGNMAGIMPAPGFLQLIRKLCDEYGIIMIMDEVKTGFRVARGGAAEYFGVHGDLMTYAKSLANGYPLAAIGGSDEVMSAIEPGKLAHGGTYCGNAVGAAAAMATLDILATTDALDQINARGTRLMQGLGEIFTEAGLEHEITGVPAMFGITLEPQVKPIRNYRDGSASNSALYEELAGAMRQRGVEVEPDWREPFFLCAALSPADVEETLNVVNDSVKDVRRAPTRGKNVWE